MPKGFIYFIGADGSDTIKIGYSVKPRSRIRQIQSGNPEDLKVLHMFPGTKRVEAILHGLFRPSRLKGEWFTNADEIRNFARHAEYCHTARVLKLMGLDGWPADEETQLRVLDRFDVISTTEDFVVRVAADIWPEKAAATGMRRRVPPKVQNWPASLAALPANPMS